jgi:hypothetical protein
MESYGIARYIQNGRSTDVCLHDLVQKIGKRVRIQKSLYWVCFLEIDGAFVNASFVSMNTTSGKLGVGLTLRRWNDAMICCRSDRVEIGALF